MSASPKASAFPDPVGDFASTSDPAIASGSPSCWIGNGDSIPRLASASTICGRTPSARNDSCDISVRLLGSGYGFEISRLDTPWLLTRRRNEKVNLQAASLDRRTSTVAAAHAGASVEGALRWSA